MRVSSRSGKPAFLFLAPCTRCVLKWRTLDVKTADVVGRPSSCAAFALSKALPLAAISRLSVDSSKEVLADLEDDGASPIDQSPCFLGESKYDGLGRILVAREEKEL
jgi:hypothetical protein